MSNPKDVLTGLVIAKWLVEILASVAKDQGYTQGDLDKTDSERAAAIEKFKAAAGIRE